MGREVVEGWRRGEGWGGVWEGLVDVGVGNGVGGGDGDGNGEGGDRGVVLRARVRGDDVWGVERVVEALEGYEVDELQGGEGKGKGNGRVRLEVVVEDMKVKVERPERGEEMTVMAGWDGVGFGQDFW